MAIYEQNGTKREAAGKLIIDNYIIYNTLHMPSHVARQNTLKHEAKYLPYY